MLVPTTSKRYVDTPPAGVNPNARRGQFPHQDSKRVLECLQKSLRIANSATEEIITVQLYCDTLDRYLYYLDRDAPAVRYSGTLSQRFTYHSLLFSLFRLHQSS